MSRQIERTSRRRDFLKFCAVALGGGAAGGIATSGAGRFLADSFLAEAKTPIEATEVSSTGSFADRADRADRLVDSIFVHDFSDGSGTAENDDAAITAAFADAAKASWTRPVMFTRPFKVLTEHAVPFGAVIQGIHENTMLQPQAPIRSVFYVTQGRSTIRNLTCRYPKYLSTSALPCDFVRVEKPWDSYPVRLEKLSAFASRNIVRWVDGDMPQIDGLYGINNFRAAHFENNGMNGRVMNIFELGGGGLYIGKNINATKPQQMEGTTFSNLRFLPAKLGPDGVPSAAGLEISAGLALRFYDLLVDQVYHSGGVRLDATAYPIDDIKIYGIWLGFPVGPSGRSASSAIKAKSDEGNIAAPTGFYATGPASRIHVYGGKIVGFPRWGIFLDKTRRFLLDGVEMRLNGTKGVSDSGDFRCVGARGMVRSCDFNSSTRTVSEADGSLVYGEDNYFAASTNPVSVTAAGNWARNSGPGAPT